MDDIELETRSMVDEGAELKHGVTCLRSRPIENSLLSTYRTRNESFQKRKDISITMHDYVNKVIFITLPNFLVKLCRCNRSDL